MTGPRRWRILRAVLLLVLGLSLVTFAAAWWLLAGSLARLDGSRPGVGLTAAVSVSRDALGTVTVEGTDRGDISYALGYVHAQERFFAMDLMRRVSAGELAALVGPAALEADRNHRRHRLRSVAEAAYTQLAPEQRHQLDRYRDGVNAGLADLRVRPWEYLVLGTQPQPWRAEDSALVIAAMYLDLNQDGRNERELRFAQMRAALPGPLVDFLLAPDPDWEAPLAGRLSRVPVVPGAAVFDLRTLPPLERAAGIAAALAPALDTNLPGSNSFAVSGALADHGAAILANDMHLTLRVPNIWFRTRLRYPDPTAPGGQRDINGVTLPGTPAVIVGSNGQIAWGFTNSYGDWQDWVRVRRDPADPGRYQVPEGWARIESHQEHIQVKGAPDALLQVDETRWGPIMAADTDGTPLALAWIAGQPRAYNVELMQLERTTDVADALDLAPTLGMPPQNLVVADSAGNIGWTIAGNSIPLRKGFDPLLPADWSRPGYGWQGWAAPARYPRIVNPADGRLWTANNRTIDGDGLTLLGNSGHDLGARAQQIRDDLRARGRFTPGNLLDIQLDARAVFLTRWQHLLQHTLTDSTEPDLKQLREITSHWHERAAVHSVDYRLVRAFRDQVIADVLAPFAARVQQRYGDFSWPGEASAEAAVWMLIRQQPANLLDPKHAGWHALLTNAARQVARRMSQLPGGLPARQWGEHNRADIRHPLSPALPAWLAHFIDMPDQPLAGDRHMPHVASPGFGASERLAVAPGHEAQGTLAMPGGQSGNPLSPFFGAGHQDWVHGRATPLLPGKSRHTMTLQPATR